MDEGEQGFNTEDLKLALAKIMTGIEYWINYSQMDET